MWRRVEEQVIQHGRTDEDAQRPERLAELVPDRLEMEREHARVGVRRVPIGRFAELLDGREAPKLGAAREEVLSESATVVLAATRVARTWSARSVSAGSRRSVPMILSS